MFLEYSNILSDGNHGRISFKHCSGIQQTPLPASAFGLITSLSCFLVLQNTCPKTLYFGGAIGLYIFNGKFCILLFSKSDWNVENFLIFNVVEIICDW